MNIGVCVSAVVFPISPGHLWFEVEQIATEAIFAFMNSLLYPEYTCVYLSVQAIKWKLSFKKESLKLSIFFTLSNLNQRQGNEIHNIWPIESILVRLKPNKVNAIIIFMNKSPYFLEHA